MAKLKKQAAAEPIKEKEIEQLSNEKISQPVKANFKTVAKTNVKAKEPAISNKKKLLEIEKELKCIYQDDKGCLPKMTSLEFKKRNGLAKGVITTIIILAILFTVSFLGFLVFQPTPTFTGDKINLELKAPFTAAAGEKIDYQIQYTNQEQISLTKMQLTVNLPLGFIMEKASQNPETPTDQNSTGYSNIKTWRLEDLSPNKTDTLIISGRLIASLDTDQTVSALLSYTPDNFSSEFQLNQSFTTKISTNLAKIEITYPSQIANAEKTEINFTLTNNSETIDLSNLELEFNYPMEFILAETQISEAEQPTQITKEEKTLENSTNSKIWQWSNLAPQQQQQIKVIGTFEITASLKAEFNLKIKLKGPAENYITIEEKNFSFDVIKGELINNLIIQGSNQNKAVAFGDTLTYLLVIQNKSKKPLGELKIRAVMESPLLDWGSLADKNNGIKEDNQILWTKEQISNLQVLLPEDEVEITFQIKIKDWAENNKYKPEDYKVTSFFESQVNMIGDTAGEIVLNSNTIINEINSNLVFTGQARYFDDNKLAIGSGPIPPVIGQKTQYIIRWQINNSLHEIKNIEIKAKLPDYITFENQNDISTGSLFQNQNKEVVWQISRIPITVKNASAEFTISLTPSEADANKMLTLIPEAVLQATDSQTNWQIIQKVTGLTTNLDGDPLAEGKGLVQSP